MRVRTRPAQGERGPQPSAQQPGERSSGFSGASLSLQGSSALNCRGVIASRPFLTGGKLSRMQIRQMYRRFSDPASTEHRMIRAHLRELAAAYDRESAQ